MLRKLFWRLSDFTSFSNDRVNYLLVLLVLFPETLWKKMGSFEMLLVSLLFKFLAFVFLMFVFLLFSNDWTRNGTLWQPPRKGGLTQLHTRMCCNKKIGIVNITRIKKKKFVHCYCQNMCSNNEKRF